MDWRKALFSVIILALLTAVSAFSDEQMLMDSHTFVKCETPYILEYMQTGVRKIAARPSLDTSVLSEQGHFRVYFDTSGPNAPDITTDDNQNGISDYVDSTLVYLEYAWDVEVNQLGYLPPFGDGGEGGGDEIDVYIIEYGTGGYGGTYPTNSTNGTSSAYIKIDNGYTEYQYASKGYDALRITIAHEFFHAIQFRYSSDFTLRWWMEQSAVWMEERVWSDVNDYLAYLYYFFGQNTTSLDNNDLFNNYMYGAALWPMYLSKRFDDGIIKDLWEYLATTGTLSISTFEDVIPVGLPDAFNEFAVWNYFTGDRANIMQFYPDCDHFDESVITDITAELSPAADSLTTNHLTSRYVELFFVGSWEEGDALNVKISPREGGSFASSLILFNNPADDYLIYTIDEDGESIPLLKSWEQAVLVTSCTNTTGSNYRYIFETEITSSPHVDTVPLHSFIVHSPYPNPFNPSTTISFTLPESGHAQVRVFNITGQKVADLFDGQLSAGEKRILWKPENLAGGIYLVRVDTPSGSKTTKLLFMK